MQEESYTRCIDRENLRVLKQLGHFLGTNQRRDRIGGVANEQNREARVPADLRA
jgi:hypothetical protein